MNMKPPHVPVLPTPTMFWAVTFCTLLRASAPPLAAVFCDSTADVICRHKPQDQSSSTVISAFCSSAAKVAHALTVTHGLLLTTAAPPLTAWLLVRLLESSRALQSPCSARSNSCEVCIVN